MVPRVTQYTVSLIPEDIDDYIHWMVQVTYRGKGNWSVDHMGSCLCRDMTWEFIPRVPDDDSRDAWIADHRFSEQEALKLAEEVAPTVKVNGLYPKDILEKYGRDECGLTQK